MNSVSTDLDRRFRVAAAREHMLDVAYDMVDSPIGPLLVAGTERGLCRIAYDADPEREVDLLAQVFCARRARSMPRVASSTSTSKASGSASTLPSISPCWPISTDACCASSRVCPTGRLSPTASSRLAPHGRAPLEPSER